MTTTRDAPGELTAIAVIVLVVSGYAFARAGRTGVSAATTVGVFVLVLFAIGVVWPIVSLRRLRVEARAPRDALVGDEIGIELRIQGRASRIAVRLLDPPGAWLRTTAPVAGELPHAVQRRGVFRHLRVEVRARGPLGVMMRRKVFTIELPFPILVGPRPIDVRLAMPLAVPGSEHAVSLRGVPDSFRSVRAYEPGDAARLVHWPTTARLGQLAVRELDPPSATGLALVVDLRSETPGDAGDEQRERAASLAAGIGRAVLAAGGRLVIATHERGGPALGDVDSTLGLSRRLAAATQGPPAAPPAGWMAEVVTP